MSSGKVKCTCGWSWNKSDSSKKDMYICHECGRDNSNNMKNGGWLDSYADGGNIGDPKVGDPKPTYWKSKVYKGPTKFNECKGEGCSKQATKGVASLYNLDYSSLNPQDAWYKRSAVIKGGGKEIYNASSKNDINSVYGDLRVGDFVSLDRPGESHSKDVSKVEGYDLSDNEKTEHLGYVVGFDKNGTPLIKHGWEGNLISGAKSYVQPITNISLPDIGYDYTVNSIYRASPLLNNDKEVNNKYYKNISPSIPLSFDSKKNLTDDKQNFIDAYNKNSDKFQLETGLSPEEVAAIGNISYGIFGNESKFNESLKRPVKQIGAEALDFFGLKDTPPSLGPTQIKYDQVGGDKNNTRKSKLLRSLGVEKEDLNNVILPTDYDAVSKATFALLAENYRNLKTNPKFKYNSETNTVLGNVPIGVALAKSWQNPSLKNVEETLQAADSDYANSVYKNMSELEGNMFPVELKEVVIEGKKKENGGWLNKYADGGTMQEHQENYNNSQASAPEGMVGDGFSNVGRNYSPAWGGQFQMGGNVYPVNYVPQAQEGIKTYSYPLRDKLYPGEEEYFKANPHVGGMAAEDNQVIINPYSPLSDEEKNAIRMNETARLAMRNGYARPTFDLTPEQKEAFKNYSTDEQDIRETIVGRILSGDSSAKNVTPEQKKYAEELQKVLKFQGGGSIPGAVGFTYARVGGAPSNGPYAKKTMASAQNGQEMKFYQEGLDWQPKTISQNGYTTGDKVTYGTPEYTEAYNRGEVITDEGVRSPIALDEVVIQNNYRRPRGFWEQYADKIVEENKDAGVLGAIIGTPISAITSLPQLAMMKFLTGEMQRPSEAMDIENPYGAFAVDAITDPTNLVGAGILTKEEVLAKLGDLRNVNAEGKLFNAMNKRINDMALRDLESYMAKRATSDAPLPKELEPYLSRYSKPISREEEVFRNVMGPEYRIQKEAEDMVYLDANGNIISAPENKPLNIDFNREFDATEYPLREQGFTWSLNPLGKLFGKKLPEGWHRKMGSAKGIQSMMDNKAIVSPSNDHLFFAYGKKPNENYAGVFNAVVDKSKLADSEISGFSRFSGPRGRHIGVSPVTLKGKSLVNIPITDPALSVHRRIPFTNSYVPIPKEAIINGPSTLKETLLVDPTLANFQKYGEDATKIALWLSAIQEAGHMGAGSNDKDKYPLGVPVLQRAYEASKAYVQPQLEKTADEFQKILNSTQYTNGGVIKDDRGQWDHPGEITEINSNDITMQGVPYPVLGISDTGDTKLMKPGKNYKFKGKKVTEFPMAKNGLRQEQKSLQNLDNLLNFTNYNKPQPGGWLNKYN